MFDYVIVCTLCYFVLVGILFAPKCPRSEAAGESAIDYFPEPEAIANEPEQEPVSIKVETTEVKSAEPVTITADIATEAAPNSLDTLSIRQLKKLAATAKIRRYSSLKKSELIHQLRGSELALNAI